MYENIDKMVDLLHQKIALMLQLKKALLIADLIGVPPKELGAVRSSVVDTKVLYLTESAPWKHKQLVVQRDSGERYTFPLTEVPRYLWPEDVQQAWERMVKRKAKAHTAD